MEELLAIVPVEERLARGGVAVDRGVEVADSVAVHLEEAADAARAPLPGRDVRYEPGVLHAGRPLELDLDPVAHFSQRELLRESVEVGVPGCRIGLAEPAREIRPTPVARGDERRHVPERMHASLPVHDDARTRLVVGDQEPDAVRVLRLVGHAAEEEPVLPADLAQEAELRPVAALEAARDGAAVRLAIQDEARPVVGVE